MTVVGRAHRWPLVALTILVLTLLLGAAGYLAPFERSVADARSRVLMREVRSDIVIVGIDARASPSSTSGRGRAVITPDGSTTPAAAPASVFLDIDFSSHIAAPRRRAGSRTREAARLPGRAADLFQNASGIDRHGNARPLRRFARRTEPGGVNARLVPTASRRGEISGQWRARAIATASIDPRRVAGESDAPSTFRFRRPRSRTSPTSTCWKAAATAPCWPTRPYSWARQPSSSATCSPCRCIDRCPVSWCRRWRRKREPGGAARPRWVDRSRSR